MPTGTNLPGINRPLKRLGLIWQQVQYRVKGLIGYALAAGTTTDWQPGAVQVQLRGETETQNQHTAG